MLNELKEIVKNLKDLPSAPRAACQILTRIRNPKLSLAALANTIALDPMISARILKMANSAYYGQEGKVTTLEKAFVLIGEKNLKNLVVETCLESLCGVEGPQDKYFQADSLGCAIAARAIAMKRETADPEEAFLGGMFRHIGKLVMFKRDPEMYRRVLVLTEQDESRILDVEVGLFAFSHNQVGAALLDFWGFTPQLVQATLHHHDFASAWGPEGEEVLDPEIYNLAATINLAECLCRFLGIGCKAPRRDLDLENLPGAIALNVSEEQIDELLETVRNDWANG